MPTDEMIDELLVDADPVRDLDVADADSLRAQALLRKVKRPRRRLARRVGLVSVAAALVVGGSIAYADRNGTPGSVSGLGCVQSDQSDAVMNFDVRTDDPIATCRAEWRAFFHEPAPSELIACVDNSSQGSLKVYPAADGHCESHDAVPYAGPSEEQLRFAAFDAELRALEAANPSVCVTRTELEEIVRDALDKHGLQAWTIGYSGGYEPDDRTCSPAVGYNEPERRVILIR